MRELSQTGDDSILTAGLLGICALHGFTVSIEEEDVESEEHGAWPAAWNGSRRTCDIRRLTCSVAVYKRFKRVVKAN